MFGRILYNKNPIMLHLRDSRVEGCIEYTNKNKDKMRLDLIQLNPPPVRSGISGKEYKLKQRTVKTIHVNKSSFRRFPVYQNGSRIMENLISESAFNKLFKTTYDRLTFKFSPVRTGSEKIDNCTSSLSKIPEQAELVKERPAASKTANNDPAEFNIASWISD